MKRKHIIVGIDEAGRGPLAGPLAVGVVAATANSKFLRGIRDSKKLSARQREKWFEIIAKNFDYKVVMVGPATIDKIGISKAAKLAVARVLRKFSWQRTDLRRMLVLLDGSLFAPKYYNQKTIVRGDEKIPLISAASIVAKVTRDRKMCRLHKLSPEYCFNIHKGYGTKLHYKKLKKNGISKYHRKSFL